MVFLSKYPFKWTLIAYVYKCVLCKLSTSSSQAISRYGLKIWIFLETVIISILNKLLWPHSLNIHKSCQCPLQKLYSVLSSHSKYPLELSTSLQNLASVTIQIFKPLWPHYLNILVSCKYPSGTAVSCRDLTLKVSKLAVSVYRY